jgi:hypothetical protein
LVRESLFRQQLINEDHVSGRCVVRIGKCLALEERCPHDLEIPGKNNLVICRLKLAGVGECLSGAPTDCKLLIV